MGSGPPDLENHLYRPLSASTLHPATSSSVPRKPAQSPAKGPKNDPRVRISRPRLRVATLLDSKELLLSLRPAFPAPGRPPGEEGNDGPPPKKGGEPKSFGPQSSSSKKRDSLPSSTVLREYSLLAASRASQMAFLSSSEKSAFSVAV